MPVMPISRADLVAAIREAQIYGVNATSDANQKILLQVAIRVGELFGAIERPICPHCLGQCNPLPDGSGYCVHCKGEGLAPPRGMTVETIEAAYLTWWKTLTVADRPLSKEIFGQGYVAGWNEKEAQAVGAQSAAAEQVTAEPVAEMIYFKRQGSSVEDRAPALFGACVVDHNLITRRENLYRATPADQVAVKALEDLAALFVSADQYTFSHLVTKTRHKIAFALSKIRGAK